MAQTSHGLRIQAAHAIARNEEVRLQLSVIVNRLKEDSDDNVEIPVELLSTVIQRLGNDNLVMQKMDTKIAELIATIDDLQK